MKTTGASRAVVPQTAIAKIVLPFAVPIMLTFALLLLIGSTWPRDLAPGSGLKLAGLCATAITTFAVWRNATSQVENPKVCKAVAVLCAITGLMGWPVWSVGVLPSVNGAALHDHAKVRMRLERTEITHASKSRELYHWAWLKAERDNAAIGSGRYFIANDVFDRLSRTAPSTVDVTIAQGLLGARVVLAFE